MPRDSLRSKATNTVMVPGMVDVSMQHENELARWDYEGGAGPDGPQEGSVSVGPHWGGDTSRLNSSEPRRGPGIGGTRVSTK
jgi:hypothetical protein